MVIPLLPTLLTLEPHNPSTERSDEELQFEEIRLTWIKTHPIDNPSVSQSNIQQNRKCTKMYNHHSVHIPTYEGEEDLRQHWFVCERMWDAADVTDDDKKIAQFVGALRKRTLT